MARLPCRVKGLRAHKNHPLLIYYLKHKQFKADAANDRFIVEKENAALFKDE